MYVRLQFIVLASLLVTSASFAQTQRSGSDTQRFMQQYQQISQEKTALQEQLEQSKKSLAATQTELDAIKKERDALKAKPARPTGPSPESLALLTASKDAAERNLEQYKQRMTEIVSRYREMTATLRDTETDRNKWRDELTRRNAAFDKCAVDNDGLYQINSEILDRYEHVGVFSRASAAEPFTKITRTRIENLADEYRERAQQLRVKKQSTASANSAQPVVAPSAPTPPTSP